MGTAKAGFEHVTVIERDSYACETIRENARHGLEPIVHWRLFEGDVRDFDYRDINEPIHLVAGGPPCQPFSLGGNHRGHADARDMFPEAIRAVRELKPRAFIFENVRGLAREAFANYLEYICLQLSFPDITRRNDEAWPTHLNRLKVHNTSGAEPEYRVVRRVLNAANFGVPQKRERIFIVGFQGDIDWSFPEPTHSQDALLWGQWVVGDYWDRHRVKPPEMPGKLRGRVNRLRNRVSPPFGEPWTTVRDAIGNLPDPETDHGASNWLNHNFNPGARTYPGHTGSPLDEPAKALKAGDHGVPGGENMLRRADGSVRYFSVRESARLQTFPDDYRFHGSWTETMRQLGNAVPVRLANIVASSVLNKLAHGDAVTAH